ncbi:hypothetical protein DL89DRAFT_134330 [Linderina pennispora]|uniref:Uncharacterized protein n=1 Tax=Linderina pennispora TaxID=61395 RepID=A0A1Y1WA85_9FUNG|nr:uncharacterized protein DL89DRAFT_134330 [Linderina pennispora]ORX70441.1 hypothetical protein DL89DRAFT_134330 [Linderina pennispora]
MSTHAIVIILTNNSRAEQWRNSSSQTPASPRLRAFGSASFQKPHRIDKETVLAQRTNAAHASDGERCGLFAAWLFAVWRYLADNGHDKA